MSSHACLACGSVSYQVRTAEQQGACSLTVPEPRRVLQKAASLSDSVFSCIFKTPGLQSLFAFHCEGKKVWNSRREVNLNVTHFRRRQKSISLNTRIPEQGDSSCPSILSGV